MRTLGAESPTGEPFLTPDDALKRVALWESAASSVAFWGGAVWRTSLWARLAWHAEMRIGLFTRCDDVLGVVAAHTPVSFMCCQ